MLDKNETVEGNILSTMTHAHIVGLDEKTQNCFHAVAKDKKNRNLIDNGFLMSAWCHGTLGCLVNANNLFNANKRRVGIEGWCAGCNSP